ncbi:uncharacterized protein LOC126391579 isoform X2 [Epinephelus moara]|uniref:uncharacterized protein LOC126391579 isoform X2 n=1 Tax=Epinephelus moara TaxID=300413 RepID=UPI00214E2C3E|nr:uncharacterized protein LOC126391579 isoform X2 [Epinephelus moara]
MKLFVCCLLLPFADMVVTAPIRARRENVLSLLNDAFGTTTEKTTPASTTDMSEARSTENFNTNGLTGPEVSDKNGSESRDAIKGLGSDEIMIPKVVEKAFSRWETNVGSVNISRRLVQDQGSRELGEPHGADTASREWTDLNSEEGVMMNTQGAENLSGQNVIRLSGDQVTGRLQRKATPERVHGLNGMMAPYISRELVDPDSLEENNGRPAPVGNRGDVDHDETREFVSSETYYPIAPPEHMPSSFSAPAKSRAS